MSTLTTITKESNPRNIEILNTRVEEFNKRATDIPRVGDYIKLVDTKNDLVYYTRVTLVHIYHYAKEKTLVQTGGRSNSFHLSDNGFISYSGGLDSGIKLKDITYNPEETKKGYIWFFSENRWEAHNSVNYEIDFRVYTVNDDADINGLQGYHNLVKKLENDKLPKIETVNGNGHKMSNAIPFLIIDTKELNNFVIERIVKCTDLLFKPCWGGYGCQPQSYDQYVRLLTTYNFVTKYYNNSVYSNTIILKFYYE